MFNDIILCVFGDALIKLLNQKVVVMFIFQIKSVIFFRQIKFLEGMSKFYLELCID